MIHYALRCSRGHEFDGWFKDSRSFEAQADGGFLACPACATNEVTRALMAPRLARRVAAPAEPVPPATQAAAADPVATPASVPATRPAMPLPAVAAQFPPLGRRMPDDMRAALQRLRSQIEAHCDYVGQDFADEARRIHAGAADPRPIYGEASQTDAEALAEEGIEVASIPWVPRADG
jgi:hypothetical protein